MMRKIDITKKTAIAILGYCLFLPNSASAFIWPKVAPAEIAGFVNNVTTGISKVAGGKAQIEGYIGTIQAIGDQVSMVAKYVSDIQQAITTITDSVDKLDKAMAEAKTSAEDAMKTVKDETDKVSDEKKQTAENTVTEVEKNIDNEDEPTIQEMVEQAKNENEERDKEIEKMLSDVDKNITEALNGADKALDNLAENINQTNELDDTVKQELQQEINQVKGELKELKEESSQLLSNIKEKYTTESAKILSAYEEYNKTISEYYAGKITKEELVKAGQLLKDTIAAVDYSIDKEQIDKLISKAEDIVEKTQELQEKVMNKIANNKEYSDDDDKTSSLEKKMINDAVIQCYTYNYHAEHEHTYAKSIYAKKSDKSFLMSKELDCDNINIEILATSSADVSKFRECLTRAKTEKEYFAMKGLEGCQYTSQETLNACNPFKNDLYKKYSKKGVYTHILEDYDAANVVNVAKTKQYAHSWQDTKEGVIHELTEKLQKNEADNTRAAYQLLGLIELEAPKLWSQIRRVDALSRAKKGINYYGDLDTLYIDGRNDDFVEATSSAPGRIDDQDVFPNVMLYNCDLTASDVSIDSEDNDNALAEAEKKIVQCMKRYKKCANTGGDPDPENCGSETITKDAVKEEWAKKEVAAATDSMFKNITLATINLYKSSLDFTKNMKDGDNIVTLQQGILDAKKSMDDYAAGAKVNYYTTNQILSIIEADAVELQTKIIHNLGELSINFFKLESEGGQQ